MNLIMHIALIYFSTKSSHKKVSLILIKKEILYMLKMLKKVFKIKKKIIINLENIILFFCYILHKSKLDTVYVNGVLLF